MLAGMSGHARAFLACLLALAPLVSAPVTAAWADPRQQYPAAQPPPLAPPGATAPVLRGPDQATWAAYHASRKSEGVALAIEFVLPGLGSIYADHWTGAATTWGVGAAGFLSMAWGLSQIGIGDGAEPSETATLAFVGGFVMTIGARVHGLVDAFRSTSRYNRGLARRLGLYGGMVLTPMPLQVNGQTALGLGASWQF
jgi:hypothetical protein